MTRTIRRVSVSLCCDISFNAPVLDQSTGLLVTAGVSIEQFAGSRPQRTLRRSFNVGAVVIDDCVIGVSAAMMGLLRVRIAWQAA